MRVGDVEMVVVSSDFVLSKTNEKLTLQHMWASLGSLGPVLDHASQEYPFHTVAHKTYPTPKT